MAVLPQGGDGVGHGFTVADRGDCVDRAIEGELMEESGRQRIEQVGVVDTEDEPCTIGTVFAQQCLSCGGEEGDGIAGRGSFDEVREGTERDAPSGFRPRDPAHRGGQRVGGHPGQGGLADSGISGEDHTASAGVRQGRDNDFQFPPPLNQWPALIHAHDRRSAKCGYLRVGDFISCP